MLTPSRAKTASCFPLLALHDDLVQLVILELPAGADVKALSRTCHALHALVIGGLALPAAWLWKRYGSQALFKAQQQQDVAMLRQLVEVHHADVNFGRDTILHRACRDGQLGVVQYLLTVPGLGINEAREQGMTALHDACCHGRYWVLLELLKHPLIDVNEMSALGDTPLHCVVFFNNCMASARALLGHPGINVHIKSKGGQTVLALAEGRSQWRGHAEMLALLTAHIEATSHRTPA